MMYTYCLVDLLDSTKSSYFLSGDEHGELPVEIRNIVAIRHQGELLQGVVREIVQYEKEVVPTPYVENDRVEAVLFESFWHMMYDDDDLEEEDVELGDDLDMGFDVASEEELLSVMDQLIKYRAYDEFLTFTHNVMMERNDFSEIFYEEIEDELKSVYKITNSAIAAQMIGELYMQNPYRKRDPKKAYEFFLFAANNGCGAACCMLSFMYANGEFGPEDYKKAVDYATQGMLLEDVGATVVLGDCYMNGTGVEVDEALACELYFKAYELLDPTGPFMPEVQMRLGKCYLDGSGIAEDPYMAFDCFSHAIGNIYTHRHLVNDALETIRMLRELMEDAQGKIEELEKL